MSTGESNPLRFIHICCTTQVRKVGRIGENGKDLNPWPEVRLRGSFLRVYEGGVTAGTMDRLLS